MQVMASHFVRGLVLLAIFAGDVLCDIAVQEDVDAAAQELINSDTDISDHDVVADLGEDLAARILKEREQLKRQNKELKTKLSTAQRLADQRAAMLQGQAQAEANKVDSLQQTLVSVQASLKQAQGMESAMRRSLHERGAGAPASYRPVTSLQQSTAAHSAPAPRRHHRKKRILQATQPSPPPPPLRLRQKRISKAAFTALIRKLTTSKNAYKKEQAHLNSLLNNSMALHRAYEEESAELKRVANHSRAMYAAAQKNDAVLDSIQSQANSTQNDALHHKSMLMSIQRQIKQLERADKANTAFLKALNQTSSKLDKQVKKLNTTLAAVREKAAKDEAQMKNKTAKLRSTLESKVNMLNKTAEGLDAKIAKAKNASSEDALQDLNLRHEAKHLQGQDRDMRWESRQRKEHIQELKKLADELQRNLSLAKRTEKADKAKYQNETTEMQSGSAHRIKELTKGVDGQKKELASMKSSASAAANKSEAKEAETLREWTRKVQKAKDDGKVQMKAASDAIAAQKRDKKAAVQIREKIADEQNKLEVDRQKESTLKAYFGNQNEDLDEAQAQLKTEKSNEKEQKAREAKAEADLRSKAAKQRKFLQAAELKANATRKAQAKALDAAKADEAKQLSKKNELLKKQTSSEKALRDKIALEYQKSSSAEKQEAEKKKERAEELKSLKAQEAADKSQQAAAEQKEKKALKSEADREKSEAEKLSSARKAAATAAKSEKDEEKQKSDLQKKLAASQLSVSSEEANVQKLREQISSSKNSVASQQAALAAAQAQQGAQAKALQQEQANLAAIKAQLQQSNAALHKSQQSTQAAEAGAQESQRRLAQASSEKTDLEKQLRTTSAAALPWLQQQAKTEAEVRQLRGKLLSVQKDDEKHKSMLSKLLAFSRSQKAKVKLLASVMTPAHRKKLHL